MILGVKHLVYHATRAAPSCSEGGRPLLLTDYPAEWVARYFQQDYLRIDPVVRLVPNSSIPVDWAGLVSQSRETRRFFKEAESYGVGRQGLTIPVRGIGPERALISITSETSDREWDEMKPRLLVGVAAIAPFLHQRTVDLEGLRGWKDRMRLSPREKECLSLLARGEVPKQIAARLQISDTMVRAHLNTARIKLSCDNIPEAVAVAVTCELIRV